jgi:periodic tryptophan protein 2
MYTLDSGVTFDPFDLSADVNPDSIEVALKGAHYSDAVMMSFKLNEKPLITRSLEAIPLPDGEQIVKLIFN